MNPISKSNALCVKLLGNLGLQGFARMNASAPIFPTQNYFRWKYLRITFLSVSLSFKYLVPVENMQLNYHLCCLDFSGSLFWFGDELTTSIKTKLQIFGEGKKECKYFQILKVHFHNEGGLGPKRYFQVFSSTLHSLIVCAEWDSHFVVLCHYNCYNWIMFLLVGFPLVFEKWTTIVKGFGTFITLKWFLWC